MGKLYLYAVFHGNLNFSYIPKDFYPQILRRCYWPLLRIIEEEQVPLGLEFSAHTLQVVNSLDHTFVERLSRLWEEGRCEFVGSGYVQSIMPLVPARVNRENLRQGNAVYHQLLGRRPALAYVNELVYSAGLPRLYREAGYQAIMANWESGLASQEDSELLYRPCAVSAGEGDQMPVVWHSFVAYREFQRYIEGETSLDSYLDGLFAHLPPTGQRAFPLYASDWEVFDFKPWQAQPEGFRQSEFGEMDRIAQLLALLKQRQDIEFVAPSAVLSHFPDPPLVTLESSDHPLPYKKQDLSSVARWGVGGRDAVRLNTQCHQLYQQLLLAEWYLQASPASGAQRERVEGLWRELCFLWNSDFRTFTTEEKYLEFRNHMGAALERLRWLQKELQPESRSSSALWLANCSPVRAEAEPVSFTVSANGVGPNDPWAYSLFIDDQTAPCQVTGRALTGGKTTSLTLEALPVLAAGQAGTAVIRRSVRSAVAPERVYRIDPEQNLVETPAVRLRLLPAYGGSIESLEFPQTFEQAVICRIQDQSAQPLHPSGSLLPGDLVLEDQSGRSISDHHQTELLYPEPGEGHEIFLPVRCSVQTELGTIWKTYRVYLHQPRVDLAYRFQWKDAVPRTFRLGRMVLNAGAFDRNTLFYATTNGGDDVERFSLKGQHVRPDEELEGGVTSQCCLGATEGWVVLGDALKGVGFVTRSAELYSLPMVHYEKLAGGPEGLRLTLAYSLAESDETSHTLWRGHSSWSLSILGGRNDIVAETRACALLSNGGLIARSETGSLIQ
jgi:hypothetical protein